MTHKERNNQENGLDTVAGADMWTSEMRNSARWGYEAGLPLQEMVSGVVPAPIGKKYNREENVPHH